MKAANATIFSHLVIDDLEQEVYVHLRGVLGYLGKLFEALSRSYYVKYFWNFRVIR